ncbi:hypothetical protein D1B33_07805 [Lysinibacillus yapensis]|uniref:Uncharacterized protein n=1 Tax=Ureibacillus yapensis TaxID=2304605 RepID=A0A396S8L7_9BACL|nr:hypothetical protein [Lysinibacillus yapensis]RHW37439.1 hypothetical protein D1B33_07805 [Lysinibacillus yapensis]
MEVKETLVQQGKNVLNSMKDLKRLAHKEGRDRFDSFERFNANKHSFQVYSKIDAAVAQMDETQRFLQYMQNFGECFDSIRYDFEGEVDELLVEQRYLPVLEAYNEMVIGLDFEKEIINVKRF